MSCPAIKGSGDTAVISSLPNTAQLCCSILDGPPGRMWGEQVDWWGTGIKKSENKGHTVCCNEGNKMVWLEVCEYMNPYLRRTSSV